MALTSTVVASIAAPEPAPERHTLLQSLLYHLLPGLGPLLGVFWFARLMSGSGFPLAMALFLGATIGVILVELTILYWLGWKRNGRLSLEGIVTLTGRPSIAKVLLLTLGLVVWAGLVQAVLKAPLNNLLLPAFQWLPPALQPISIDFGLFSKGALWSMWLVGLVGTAWLAPAVEELYFRGFLLPRMAHLGGWAPLLNSVLFSLYHYWSPWENLTRLLGVVPMVYAGWRYRSVRLTLIVHCTLNTLGMLMMLPLLLV